MAKLEKPAKEKLSKVERHQKKTLAKMEKPKKEKLGKVEASTPALKPEKTTKIEKPEKSRKIEKPRAGKVEKLEKALKIAKLEKARKIEKLEKKMKKVDLKSEEGAVASIDKLIEVVKTKKTENLEEVLSAVKELKECRKRCLKTSAEQEGPFWADVVTDLVISLLPNSERKFAATLISAYNPIAKEITEESIEQLKAALDSTSFDEEGSDDEDEDEDGEDGSVEDEGEEKSEPESSDDEEDGEEEEDNDEPLKPEDEEFRMKLLEALGDNPGDDDEENVATDEDMFKLDEALADAFRGRFKKNKDKNEAASTLVQFKSRCGDVLLAILKHDVPLSFLLKLAPSVLRESRSCVDPKAEAAGFKAIKVLNQISSKKKLTSETPEEDVPQLVALIETSLSYSRKYSKINLQQALSNLCKWAIATIKSISPEYAGHLALITDALKDFFQKNTNHTYSSFFVNLMTADKALTLSLLSVIQPSIMDTTIRQFVRSAGLAILLGGLKDLARDEELKKDSIIAELETNVTSLLLEHTSSEEKIKPFYLSELLQVLYLLRSRSKTILLDPDSVLATNLASVKKPVVKKMVKKGQFALRKLVQRNAKRSSDAVENVENVAVPKKKKKKVAEAVSA